MMAQIKKLSKVSELLWNELRSLEREIEGTVIGSSERESLQRKYNILHDLCMVVEDSILFLMDDMLRDAEEQDGKWQTISAGKEIDIIEND